MREVWEIFSETLYLTHHFYNLQIHSFVLMNNHFHLIASTPDANISTCMYFFMKTSSYRLTRAGNRINQSYAGRYYKTILQSHNYYLNAYKYNYQNPVVSGITETVESYPFSTLFGLLGKSNLLIPVMEDTTLFSSVEQTLTWLNTPSDPILRDAVAWGLKRPYFKSKRDINSRRPILGENDLL